MENYNFDKEDVASLLKDLGFDPKFIADQTVIAVPHHELQRYAVEKLKKGIGFNVFNNYSVAMVVKSGVDGYEYGDVVHYAPMRGHKVHYHQKMDYYLVLLTKDDLLINRGQNE